MKWSFQLEKGDFKNISLQVKKLTANDFVTLIRLKKLQSAVTLIFEEALNEVIKTNISK